VSDHPDDLADRVEVAGTSGFTILPPHDALLDDEEAAAVLRVSTSTIHRWAAEGRLAYHRLGRRGRRLFTGADIKAFLRSTRQERTTLGQRVSATLGTCRRRGPGRSRPRASATGKRERGPS